MGPRVLHVVTRAQRRGAELAAVTLGAELAAVGWPGDVVALAPAGDGAALDLPVLGPAPRAPATLRALRRRAADATVVVAHGSATLWASVLAVAPTGRPFVYVSIGDPRFWSGTPQRRWRTGLALRRASRVAALTPTAAATLARWFGLPEWRVRVLPNFRPVRRFQPPTPRRRAETRRALGIGDRVPVALVLGALSPEKRPLDAIESALGVPDVHVLVAGDGPLRAQVAALAAARPDRVHVAGPVEDPLPLLQAADVLVLSSASEGLPGVIIEAGLCGLPTAATAVGWIPDLVREGSTGALAPPGDVPALSAAVSRALRDGTRLGAAALAHCRRGYTDQAVLPAWVSLLESLTSAPLIAGRAGG